MAETILGFLRFGANPGAVQFLSQDEAADFLPAIALRASSSSPSSMALLAPLVSLPQTALALACCALDYVQIAEAVSRREEGRAGLPVDLAQPEPFKLLDFGSGDHDYGQDDDGDESLAFEMADQVERIIICITSLRKRAAEFDKRLERGNCSEEVWIQLCKDEGCIWSSKVCILELVCVLPISILRCPMLLTSEHVILGLLTSRWGYVLMLAAFINNPLLLKEGVSHLCQFISQYFGVPQAFAEEPMKTLLPSCSAPIAVKADTQIAPSIPSEQRNVVVDHCVKQALLTLLGLSKVSVSIAIMCRDALASHCSLAELIMHLSLEFIHDELEFLSEILFSNPKTLEWMQSFFTSPRKETSMRLQNFIGGEEDLDSLGVDSKDMDDLNCSAARHGNRCLEALRDFWASSKDGVALRIRRALLASAQAVWENYGWSGKLHNSLRVFCILVPVCHSDLTHEETVFWLSVLGRDWSESVNVPAKKHPNRVHIFERTLQLGMAFLCLVPGLVSPSDKPLLHESLSLLMTSALEAPLSPGCDIVIWLAVQIMLQNSSDIATISDLPQTYDQCADFFSVQLVEDWVLSDILGIHVMDSKIAMKELYDAAVAAKIISEPLQIVKAVAVLCPKTSLGVWSDKDFSWKCVEQLLHTSYFNQYGVDLSEIVIHCIEVAEEPIQLVVVKIVKGYAQSINLSTQMESVTHASAARLSQAYLEGAFEFSKKIPSSKTLKEVLKKVSKRDMVRALLTSYYVLCQEAVLRDMSKKRRHHSSDSLVFESEEEKGQWWSDLIVGIPFQLLLQYMEGNWHAYEHLLPKWLSLVSLLFPEHVLVWKILDTKADSVVASDSIPRSDDLEWVALNTSPEEDGSNQGPSMVVDILSLSPDLISRLLKRALVEPLPALRVLQFLMSSVQDIAVSGVFEIQQVVIAELLPLLLESSCSRSLQESFCTWWLGLPRSARNKLLPQFLTSISAAPDNNNSKSVEDSALGSQIKQLVSWVDFRKRERMHNELVQRPLTLLGCKDEVFRTPLVSVVLDLLMEAIVTNRRVSLAAAVEGGKVDSLTREEISSALAAQDSVACQILLEACLPNARWADTTMPGPLLESRKAVCGFLSSLFHMNPLLLKLLHFQGYDPSLVSMLVEGVPIMKQCLDFVPELLEQQQQEKKKMFAIILVAEITSAYPEHPLSLSVVKQVVSHVRLIIEDKAGATAHHLKEALNALAKCGSTFPVVAVEVVSILQACATPPGKSAPHEDPLLHEAALSAFKHLIRSKVLFGRPSLPPRTSLSGEHL